MPFNTMCTSPVQSPCGCAFSSVTRPWVAQRVWPRPIVAGGVATATPPSAETGRSASRPIASRRFARFPTARTVSTCPSVSSEMPAESYPRYSSFSSPATSRSRQGRPPTYPTMPHMEALKGTRGLSQLSTDQRHEALADLLALLFGRCLDHHADQGLGARGADQDAAAALERRALALHRFPHRR